MTTDNPILNAIYSAWRGDVPERTPRRGRKRSRTSFWRSSCAAVRHCWDHIRRRGGR